MGKCNNCGAEGQNGKFCSYCGAKLNIETVKEEKEGNWPVVIFKHDDMYFAYDVFTEEETDEFKTKSKCKQVLKSLIEKNIKKDGVDELPTIDDINKDPLVVKYNKKIQSEIEFIDIDLSLSLSGSEDEEDSSTNEDRNFVYAVIEHNSMFYNGEIPNMKLYSNVRFCRSREECIDKLTQMYQTHKNSMFDKTKEQDIDEIKEEFSDAEIIKIMK